MELRPTWLGDSEGIRLEYKSARARPEQIVRAVVALLNLEGGYVVVGVDDRGNPEGLTDAARTADGIQQLLAERVVPRPPPGSVDATVRQALGVDVVEIRVGAATDALHAERRKGLLGFWIREGATTRGLRIDEVAGRLGAPVRDVPPLWPSLLKRWQSRPLLIGALVPLDEQQLGADRLKELGSALPTAWSELDLRPTGWIVLPPPDWPLPPPRPVRGELKLASPDDYHGLIIRRSAEIVGVAHGPALCHYAQGTRPVTVLRPDALVETFVSTVRTAALVARRADLRGRVRLELKLAGSQEWLLRPHMPGSIGWSMPDGIRKEASLEDEPEAVEISTTWSELVDGADRLAHGALVQLWDWFGWDGDLLPCWNAGRARFAWLGA